MNILITGAAGFIGSHLVDLLLKEGVQAKSLRLLVWGNENLSNLPKKNFQIIRGDIRDKELIRRAVDKCDVIYHLAAKIDFEGKSYQNYYDVNVAGTKNLLESSRKNKLQKFVFFSSIGVFGLPAGIGEIINWDENHPKTYTNYYGRSKWEAEVEVMQAFKKWGIPYAIVRPASVYGPREKGPTLALYRAIKKHQFIRIGNGENLMHYVYVGDLVKGARLAQLSKIKDGDYILAGNKPIKFKDMVNLIAKSLNEKVPGWYIPKDIALLLSRVIETAGDLVGKKPPIYASRVRTMTTTYFYNISKAKSELKYTPKVNFEKGSKITGKWYLENGYL